MIQTQLYGNSQLDRSRLYTAAIGLRFILLLAG